MMQKAKSGKDRRNKRKSPLNALSMTMWFRVNGVTWEFKAPWGTAVVVRQGAGWVWNGKVYSRSRQARKAAQRDVALALS